MAGGYASGKKALGICDRCGFQFPSPSLRKEWTGMKVCFTCYEPKHPQLDTKRNITDPQALRDPRPDQVAAMDVYVGAPGDTAFTSEGMRPTVPSKDIVGAGEIGTVTVVTT